MLVVAAVIAVLVVQRNRVVAGVGVFLLAALVCLAVRELVGMRFEMGRLVGAQRRELRRLQVQIEQTGGGLWGLLGLVTVPNRLLPRLSGAALQIPAAHALAELVVRTNPRVVVELGPGASTTVLGLVGPSLEKPMEIWSLEDHDGYARRVRELVTYLGIDGCNVVSAPLVEQQVGSWSGRWYCPEAVDELPGDIGLLLVDGPANEEQHQARFPAYEALRSRLAPDAIVFVDDTNRPDEWAMVEAWMKTGTLQLERRGETFAILRHCPATTG